MVEQSIQWHLVPIATAFVICSVISFMGNAIMIIVFIRQPSFKSTYHYLIAANCLADLLHTNGHFIFAYNVFFKDSVTQDKCFWIQAPSLFGLFASGPLILGLGIDRFIACSWPIGYQALSFHPKKYRILQLIFPISYTANALFWANYYKNPYTRVKCALPQALGGKSFGMFAFGGFTINLLIIIVYLFTYLQLKKKRESSHMKLVFKSIFVTVLIVFFGWTSMTFVNSTAVTLIKDQNQLQVVIIYAGILTNFGYASNVFVFYSIKYVF